MVKNLNNTNTKIHLFVDSKDLSCPVCFLRFSFKENYPISLGCGHTFCSDCILQIDKCALCKVNFCKRQPFKKSIVICSLLEGQSKAKKCEVHQKYLEGFCLNKKKLVCFDCLAEQQGITPIKDIEEKVEEITEAIEKAQQRYEIEVGEFLQMEQENFKNKIDGILQKEICFDLLLKDRIYKRIEELMGVEKNCFQNEVTKVNLMKKWRSAEQILGKWKEGDNVVAEILELKGDGRDNLEETFKELKRELKKKQKEFFAELDSNERLIKLLSQKLKTNFDLSYQNFALAEEVYFEIEANYMVNFFREFNLVASWTGDAILEIQDGSGIMNSQAKFDPIFLSCRMREINMNVKSTDLSKNSLEVLCGILGSISGLEKLTLRLPKLTASKFYPLLNLLLRLKSLGRFKILAEKCNKKKPVAKFLERLKSLKSEFKLRLTNPDHRFVLSGELKSLWR